MSPCGHHVANMPGSYGNTLNQFCLTDQQRRIACTPEFQLRFAFGQPESNRQPSRQYGTLCPLSYSREFVARTRSVLTNYTTVSREDLNPSLFVACDTRTGTGQLSPVCSRCMSWSLTRRELNPAHVLVSLLAQRLRSRPQTAGTYPRFMPASGRQARPGVTVV